MFRRIKPGYQHTVRILGTLSVLLAFVDTAQAATTPSDVYSAVDELERIQDTVLTKLNRKVPREPEFHETDVKPMHVYQIALATMRETYDYQRQQQLQTIPLVVASPIRYSPADVATIVDMLLESYRRLAAGLGIDSSRIVRRSFKGKTPVQVFSRMQNVLVKAISLSGQDRVTPSVTFVEVVRARADLQRVLLELGARVEKSERRKQLVSAIYGLRPDGENLSPFVDGKKPKDVLGEVLRVRRQINDLHSQLGSSPTKVPTMSEYTEVRPIDVLIQTQIVIADINLLKRPLSIFSVTPFGTDPGVKSPSHVFQEAKYINYMLKRLSDDLRSRSKAQGV